MKLINGLKPSEWLEQNRTEVRIKMIECELGAWRCPQAVTRLYLCTNGTLFEISKLYEGVDEFPNSNELICLAEFKRPGRDLLGEKLVNMSYQEIEELFLHWSTDDEKQLWQAWKNTNRGLAGADRLDLYSFFKYKTEAYAREKKSLELDVMNGIEWDKVIDNVITKLEREGN